MRGVSGERGTIGAQISILAARQYGYVRRRQLLEIGLAPRTIAKRIATGKLIVVHAGVYALGYRRREPIGLAAAAVLACGDAAVLSHLSAAVLWGMRKRWPDPPHVTVRGDRRRPRITVHRCPTLERRDIRTQRGIRCTSPARTAIDIAPELSIKQLSAAIEEARLAHFVRRAALFEITERLPHHRGASRLREALEGLAKAPTKSEFERAFLRFVKRYGLPTPRVNHPVAGRQADIVFEQERVIVELDGYDTHGTRASFESDRERDAARLAAGYVTVRITWERLKLTPQREAERLLQILENRRQQAA
jgi:very-short-patch-repair endonuclease